MKVVQNFSSKKHIKRLPLFDIMIWYIGLAHYKQLGYHLKLYCETSDIQFLKDWHLYDFYDEIDTKLLAKLPHDPRFKKINGTNFWSVRKLFCIENEFRVSSEPFIYSDTDIILYSKINLTSKTDLLVWTIEHENIYIAWDYMSVPKGYEVPDYLLSIFDAFNCGLMWFKDYTRFNEYFNEYLKFTSNNPCILGKGVTKDPLTIKNIWACNAEQRILYGISVKNNWDVAALMLHSDIGIAGFCEAGIHYYLLRGALRQTRGTEKANYWLGLLTNQVRYLMDEIRLSDQELADKFIAESEELKKVLKDEELQLEHYI